MLGHLSFSLYGNCSSENSHVTFLLLLLTFILRESNSRIDLSWRSSSETILSLPEKANACLNPRRVLSLSVLKHCKAQYGSKFCATWRQPWLLADQRYCEFEPWSWNKLIGEQKLSPGQDDVLLDKVKYSILTRACIRSRHEILKFDWIVARETSIHCWPTKARKECSFW